ncbi:hypothetical protein M2222_008271 [Bradyrhizobium elkanii]|uniref:excisionase n=1 Tax=Bradyrhizobium elkanii TaxID=29448 RepID=UPI00216709D2|nr:excisionase [Bradyrhizobium elkanii]MCS3451952.1 hypothetical protein [Bradyrhizobium elkanii]MCS3565949.1 hypothetical protein [Bradyrhizobium elkanii]MCW2153321.1 hypothetical protein [Bradyrhizobium elkanii]MCW2377054.1 hypothetical protein [Bradyrhizobium elkanii]
MSKSSSEIDQDAPMRLADAVRIAFPKGGMTVAGLRREINRGRLIPEKIAGKHFVTLAGIEEMRRKCRVEAKEPGSSFVLPGATPPEGSLTEQPGSSEMAPSIAAQDALSMKLQRLSER